MDFDISATGAFWAVLRLARLGEGDYALKELRCPRCWKHDSAPSLPAGFIDRLMAHHQRYLKSSFGFNTQVEYEHNDEYDLFTMTAGVFKEW